MLLVLMPLLVSGGKGFPAEQSLRRVLEDLQNPEDVSARFRAAKSIVEFGELAVPPLRSLLSHADVRVRSCACSALGRLGPTAQDAAPDLLAMANNPQECETQRGYAIRILGQIGPAAASAVPGLQSLLRENSDPNLRRQIINSLAAIATEEALSTLIELFQQAEEEEREAVLYALQRQGDKIGSAIPALLAASACRPDDPVGVEVFLLASVFGREAVDDLVPYLRSPVPETRRRAGLALSRLGSEASDAVPVLCETLKDQSAFVRFWAAKTLGSIGPDACRAKDFLLPLLEDADPNVRWEAVSAIVKIDPTAITENGWQRLLNDPEPGVRNRSASIRSTIR
jgi:HEAT repeat protein